MCQEAREGVHLGEFQLDQTLGINLNCTGSVLVDTTIEDKKDYIINSKKGPNMYM